MQLRLSLQLHYNTEQLSLYITLVTMFDVEHDICELRNSTNLKNAFKSILKFDNNVE